MVVELIRIASRMDHLGLHDLADAIDRIAQVDPADDPWSDEYWNRLERDRTLPEPRSQQEVETGVTRPGTRAEKDARMAAHSAFDSLWQGPNASMNRRQAYGWMQRTLGLTEEQAHIGNFGVEECNALIQRVQEYQAQRASMTPADRETQTMRDTVAKLMKKLYVGPDAPMTREQAYAFMAEKLGVPPEEAHVSQLTLQQAKRMTDHIATLRNSLRGAGAIGRNVRLSMLTPRMSELSERMDLRGAPDLADRLDSIMFKVAAKAVDPQKAIEYLKRGNVPDEVIRFVMSPGRRIPPKLQKWLAYRLRDSVAPTVQMIADGKLPPTSLQASLDTMSDEVAEIRDWAQNMQNTPRFDIFQYKTIDAAAEASAEWHRQLAEQMEKNGHPSLYKYPDYNAIDLGDGYRMVQINPNDPVSDLDNEGNLMGHCVGQGSYDNPVKEGAAEIWSLRDASGMPHTTVELVSPDEGNVEFPYSVDDFRGDVSDYVEDAEDEESIDYYAQQLYDEELERFLRTAPKKVSQIQGKEDKPPIERYRPYIYRWLLQERQAKHLTVDDDDLLTVTPSEELMARIQQNPESAKDYVQYLGEDYLPQAISFLMQPEVRSSLSPQTISHLMSNMKEDPGFQEFVPELRQRIESGEEGWGPNEVDSLMRASSPGAANFVQQMVNHQDPRVRGRAYSNLIGRYVASPAGAVPFARTPEGAEWARQVLSTETHYQPITDLLGMMRILGEPEGRLPDEVVKMLPTVVARTEKQIRELGSEDAARGEVGYMLPALQATAMEMASKNAPHLVPQMMAMVSGRLQHRIGHSGSFADTMRTLRLHEPDVYVETLNSMNDDLKRTISNPGFSSSPNSAYDYTVAKDIEALQGGQELPPPPDRWMNPKFPNLTGPDRFRPLEEGLPRDVFPEPGPEEMELAEERRMRMDAIQRDR